MEDLSSYGILAACGLGVGMLAKLIMPGKDPGGLITTSLLGIAGSLFGGWAGSYIGIGGYSGLNAASFGSALVGALVLLLGYRLIKIII